MSIPTIEDAIKKSKALHNEARGALLACKAKDIAHAVKQSLRHGKPPGPLAVK